MHKAPAVKWTREHLLIALNLYCKLPFGSFDRKNAVVHDVAARMGRTSNSLAMKLSNFASLDPVEQARGIKGLSGATKRDKQMWAEFKVNSATLGPESEQMLHDLFTKDESREVDFLQRDTVRLVPSKSLAPPAGGTESVASVKVRRGQQFFRQSILNAYGVRCCITGIAVRELLVASHIKPWAAFPDERLDPRNGLCLSTLHDVAFDCGLITLDQDCRVVLGKRLKDHFSTPTLQQNFAPFDGERIRMPDKLAEPDAGFLAFHREEIFEG
jgi:putative restriction endonuclease